MTHSRSKHIDLGAIGEQLCDVHFDRLPGSPGNREQPAEHGGVQVTSVRWLCELLPYLPTQYVADLEQEIANEGQANAPSHH